MFNLNNEWVIPLFRTESEVYDRPYPDKSEIHSNQLEKLIANEWREQINNGKERSIFSLTKFLSVALLKYNDAGYNDLILTVIPFKALNSIILRNVATNQRCFFQCTIKDEDIKKVIKEGKYTIENYIIDICKDHAELDYYLWRITGRGKKKYAACKTDGEVLIRNLIEDEYGLIRAKHTIPHNELLDFVYILYALYYKEFIYYQDLIKIVLEKNYKLANRVNNGLFFIQKYLAIYIDIEKRYCDKLVRDKVNDFFNLDEISQCSYSHGYQLAMMILQANSMEDVWKGFCDTGYNLPYADKNPFIETLLSLLFSNCF